MADETTEKIRSIIAEQLGVKVEEVADLSNPVGVRGVAVELSAEADGDVHAKQDGGHQDGVGEAEVDDDEALPT